MLSLFLSLLRLTELNIWAKRGALNVESRRLGPQFWIHTKDAMAGEVEDEDDSGLAGQPSEDFAPRVSSFLPNRDFEARSIAGVRVARVFMLVLIQSS